MQSATFSEGDICKYHFIKDHMASEISEETIDYYKSKDGKYCMILHGRYKSYIPVFFLDDSVYDLMTRHYVGSEVMPESLELVIRAKS